MRNARRIRIALSGGLALFASACATTGSEHTALREEERQEQANIQLVLDMWKGVITDASPEAVLKYIAPDYIQHNMTLEGGQKGLYEAILAYDAKRKADPSIAPHTTKRLIKAFADDDLVVLVWEMDVPEPSDPSRTYIAHSFDMFRVKDQMMVEHWDAKRK